MKLKISTTLYLILLSAVSITAQNLKQVDLEHKKTAIAADDVFIKIPIEKKMVVEKRLAGTWAPQSIKYTRNTDPKYKVLSSDNGKPLMIEGSMEKDKNRSESDAIFTYLTEVSELMGIEKPNEEWVIKSTNTDALGMTHTKCQQVINGIPVYGSEVIVHGDDKEIQLVNGRYYPTQDVNTQATISQEDSRGTVLSDLGELTLPIGDKYGLFDMEPLKQELVVLPVDDKLTLAYHFTVYKNIVERWEYFVDAHTGSIINKHESICKFHNHNLTACNHSHAEEAVPPVVSNATDLFGSNQSINTFQSGSNFFMIDASRTEMFDAINSNMPNEPIGTIWTIDAFDTSPQSSGFNYDHVVSSNINFPGKQVATSAHVNGGKAFEYFIDVHNRRSINGEGGNIISLVNVADEDGGGLDNAFWNGIAMFYGNGRNGFRELARGLDVAGHEMTHGVIQSTANLTYQGESGALNESFADVFGVMIDRDDWQIGEDVVRASAFPSGQLRSMSDPHNGAPDGAFGQGWQPKKYSERFTGSEDNGGVHINSGIPNHAFYLFATDPAVGKAKAEKVFYRALTNYLTASSQFVDARVATVRATQDLYGNAEVEALRNAWDAVEVFGENGGSYETNEDTNPGDDLIIFTTTNGTQEADLFIARPNGDLLQNPASTMDPKSKPSVTDDGSEVVYVTTEGDLGYLFINWETNEVVQDLTFQSNEKWRKAVFSKDGLRLAALRDVEEDSIYIFDFVSGQEKWYELSNPTFSQEPTSTSDVKFADAMEFDFTGEFVMYDAFNSIGSIFGDNIEYWDIGFVKVWNSDSETFALPDQIQKLFNGLPSGVSVGNPTFSKNSPYIIAFDELDNGDFALKAANLETSQIGTLFSGSDRPGYPSYSNQDDIVIFDAIDQNGKPIIAGVPVDESKINQGGQAGILLSYDVGVRWGTWFANGDRVFTSTDEPETSEVVVFPNPTTGIVTLSLDDSFSNDYNVTVLDMMGKEIISKSNTRSIDLSAYPSGQYILSIKSDGILFNKMVSKY